MEWLLYSQPSTKDMLSVFDYFCKRCVQMCALICCTVSSKKSEPLNILQQQLQICSDLNKILHTQDDICYKHYYIVSYKSALTLLKYEFLNNITHKPWVSIAVDVSQNSQNVQPCLVANPLGWWSRVSQLTIVQPSHGHGGLGTLLLEGKEVTRDWTNGWQQVLSQQHVPVIWAIDFNTSSLKELNIS